MTIMDALRAELDDWAEQQEVAPSHEVLAQFYTDGLGGSSPEELAELSVDAVVNLVGPQPAHVLVEHMATWCAAVLLGVRAARRADL
jgi:hypothetical protein